MIPDINSSFMRFEMTPQEELVAKILTHEQKAYLKNLLADNAEEQIRESYPGPEQHALWQQAQAKRAGIMEVLRYLIDSSLAAEEEMKLVSEQNNHFN